MGIEIKFDNNALDRLIGGDEEIHVRIREGVIEQFAKRRLKTLANAEFFKKWEATMLAELRKEIEEQVGKVVTTSNVSFTQHHHHAFLKQTIRDLIRNYADEIIKELLETKVKEWESWWEGQVSRIISGKISAAQETYIQQEIRRRLDFARDMPTQGVNNAKADGTTGP